MKCPQTAASESGAVWGGGVEVNNGGRAMLKEVEVHGCTAASVSGQAYGGGVAVSSGSPSGTLTLFFATLRANAADTTGTAIYAEGGCLLSAAFLTWPASALCSFVVCGRW